MNRRRFIALCAAALVVLGLALWVNGRRNAAPEFREAPLLPALAGELDTVSSLAVLKGAPKPTVTLHRSGKEWTVAERGDYPADVPKLHKLLIALADAKIVEEKTANPAEFALIGVEDPTQSGASGTEVSLSARDGAHAVIIGKPSGSGDFARRVGESQSFLVQPAISLESEPRFWIDARLIDIPLADIESMQVKLPDGASYLVRRVKPKEETFALEGVPAGRKAADSQALAPSPSLGGALTADDVGFTKDIDFGKPAELTLTLAGGKVVTLVGASSNDRHWIAIRSGADPALAARAEGRAFEIPSYRYDALFRPLEQLLVPKPAPAPKGSTMKPAGPGAPQARGAQPHARSPAPAPSGSATTPP